jgi:hypothetical protein
VGAHGAGVATAAARRERAGRRARESSSRSQAGAQGSKMPLIPIRFIHTRWGIFLDALPLAIQSVPVAAIAGKIRTNSSRKINPLPAVLSFVKDRDGGSFTGRVQLMLILLLTCGFTSGQMVLFFISRLMHFLLVSKTRWTLDALRQLLHCVEIYKLSFYLKRRQVLLARYWNVFTFCYLKDHR